MNNLNIDVSIIIVNYNTKDLLQQCLNSIYEHTRDLTFEIIVVDNNSKDGSGEMIKEVFSDVIFIQSGENVGFGRANNLGINNSKGEFVFLLNSDTILLNNSVKIFLDFYRNNASPLGKIGAVGGELLQINGILKNHSSQCFPRMIEEFKIIFNLPFVKLFNKSVFFVRKEEFLNIGDSYREVDYVTGADLFISKTTMIDIGSFDKNFFMYFEETDLQKRLRNQGFRNYLISGTKIIHYEGASSNKKKSGTRSYMLDQSRFQYYKKYNNVMFYYFFRFFYFLVMLPFFFDFRLPFLTRVNLLALRMGLNKK